MDGYDQLAPGWWVRLDGDRLDLKGLADQLSGDLLRVVPHGDRVYLHAADFESFSADDSAAVNRRAAEILRIVNGAARVSIGDHHPVSVSATALVNTDGSIQHTVHAAASLALGPRMRTKASVTGQPERSEPSEIERVSLRGLANSDAERALRIFGRDDGDYRDLYFVFEIVRAAAGSRMYEEEWASRSEVARFRRTANSPTVLGEDARHGAERTESPKDPMPLEEAGELIRRLLALWLAE